MSENVVEPGQECVDKACAATGIEGCRYPGWRLCGHPAGATAPPAAAGADLAETWA